MTKFTLEINTKLIIENYRWKTKIDREIDCISEIHLEER